MTMTFLHNQNQRKKHLQIVFSMMTMTYQMIYLETYLQAKKMTYLEIVNQQHLTNQSQ